MSAGLGDLRRYMEAHRRGTAESIAAGLGTTADHARALLDFWRAKQRVRLVPDACGGSCGGTCCGSSAALPEVYEWIGGAACPHG
ncbi:FeoC-like transcriptional regulator [Zavarzinia sp.]|uniref:FeoC-like transcriptional regulator n=1 Tax=Zavarzinia sp. TaxID=2027920 RepID=UPI003561A854